MPVSDLSNIKPILDEVNRIRPGSVLDLGVGFGKYGVLIREVLDATYGRCRREQWLARIVGVEAFADYKNPAWKVYDLIYSGVDFTKLKESDRSGYDLVLMVDSLEHLRPAEAREFLDALIEQNRNVIVSVPMGLMPQGEVYGNSFEAHRTTFYGSDFDRYEHTVLHCGICKVVSIRGKHGR